MYYRESASKSNCLRFKNLTISKSNGARFLNNNVYFLCRSSPTYKEGKENVAEIPENTQRTRRKTPRLYAISVSDIHVHVLVLSSF